MTIEPTAPLGRAEAHVVTYLIYIVLDTSESMRRPQPGTSLGSPVEHFTRLIPRMLRQLADHPVSNSLASVSVIAFNDEAEVLRLMSPLHQPVPIRRPRMGYGTDYAAVLKFLVEQYPKDVRAEKRRRSNADYGTAIARPWIFFITDGRPYAKGADQPPSAWIGYRDQLADPPVGARIVSLGLAGADETTLWLVATGHENGVRNAFIADRSTNPLELTTSVVSAIERSIATSVSTGNLAIRTPAGMLRIEGTNRG